MSNKDTSERIKRSQRNRFANGGVVQTLPYGSVKPAGAASDADVRKDAAAEPVVEGMVARLEAGASYSEVGDWLNGQGVAPGAWARNGTWDGRMVQRFVHNPILKGVRVRNTKVSVRVNKTGRRKSVAAPPEQRLERHAPHLAFVEPGRYDRLVARLTAANAHYARGRAAKRADSRAGVSKKRTVWPGQHVGCGVCGRPMYWGGHGQQSHMMCSGARDYRCWNAATFDGNAAGRRLAAAVLEAVESLPGFDEAFRTKAEAAASARRSGRADALRKVDDDLGKVEREIANVVDALGRIGFSAALQDKLSASESRKAVLTAERVDLLGQPDDVPDLPPIDELKERGRSMVGAMSFDDPAFGRDMHRLVPRVEVFPYLPVDGGKVVLRAVMTIDLAPLLGRDGAAVGGVLTRTVAVDLFDPPQRVAFRERVDALKAAGRTERQAAAELGITQPAVQHAAALGRAMRAAGASGPYRRLTAPPAGEGKLRRHEHVRYDFQPLDGYPAWSFADAE